MSKPVVKFPRRTKRYLRGMRLLKLQFQIDCFLKDVTVTMNNLKMIVESINELDKRRTDENRNI